MPAIDLADLAPLTEGSSVRAITQATVHRPVCDHQNGAAQALVTVPKERMEEKLSDKIVADAQAH